MTKLLLESWKRYLKENVSNTWYHTTSPIAINDIEKNGLKINSKFNKSQASQFYVNEIYGMNPIYISKEQGKYKNGVVLAIDVTGIELVVDIPTLISDYGAMLGEDLTHVWFEEDYTPFEMFDWVDGNGALYFKDLLNPNSAVAKAMIELTGTAVVMQNIPPNRIKIIGNS
jgi:hypothetical protein